MNIIVQLIPRVFTLQPILQNKIKRKNSSGVSFEPEQTLSKKKKKNKQKKKKKHNKNAWKVTSAETPFCLLLHGKVPLISHYCTFCFLRCDQNVRKIAHPPVYLSGLLFTVYCLLFTVYCLLFTVYCLLFTVYCLLFTVYCLLFTVYCLLFTVYCLLFTVYCLLFTVYCLLFTVYCLLFTVYCLLFTVCFFSPPHLFPVPCVHR